ncbi:MAG: HIT domain-containing protein [Nanoarchaeota archaeon]|jgi:histidine triad (HIT) family protein|nr:HIT domain-containing protein [Nanoarchaeota archaeon]
MEDTTNNLANIKLKLIDHLKKTYDEAKANELIEKINNMNQEAFLEFLKKQGLIKGEGDHAQNCVFCSMITGNIPTTNIGGNDRAIAILEINPISIGHSMIIPNDHFENEAAMPEEVKELANQISETLTKTFKPQRVDQIPGNVMGHQIINLLPIYNNETIESERNNETPEGLAKLKEQIETSGPKRITQPKPTQIEQPEETNDNILTSENTWLPKRMKP